MKYLKRVTLGAFCTCLSCSFALSIVRAEENSSGDESQIEYVTDENGNKILDSIKDVREPEVISRDDPKYQYGLKLQEEQKKKSASPFVVYRTVTHQTQKNRFYCGPASASMILGYLGYNYSQDALAGRSDRPTMLETNFYEGTPAGQSVASALNSVLSGSRFKFYWVWHNYTDVSGFKNNAMTALGYGNPIMANTVESPGDVYLQGHNTGADLYHFGVVDGMNDVAGIVRYIDPAYGYFNGFVKSQTVSYDNMSKALGGRGYAW
ncbi:MAG: C39 family peptidase [Longicatena sp.]